MDPSSLFLGSPPRPSPCFESENCKFSSFIRPQLRRGSELCDHLDDSIYIIFDFGSEYSQYARTIDNEPLERTNARR